MGRLLDNILARRPWMRGFEVNCGFTKGRSAEKLEGSDYAIVERLIAAFARSSVTADAKKPDDVWSKFVDRHYGEMLHLIHRRDARGLAAYLLELPMRGAGHGYFQGRAAYSMLTNNLDEQRQRALWLLDHLVGLAEALGVIRTRCPEQGDWDIPPFKSVDELRLLVEDNMNCAFTLPPLFSGMFSLEPDTAPMHLRTIMAAYAIFQIAEFLQRTEGLTPKDMRVAEIGSGIGFTAYAARSLGIGHLAIYDLMEVNVTQGFFLLESLEESEVSLFGETLSAPVQIRPASTFGQSDEHYHAVINIDSFPEIDITVTNTYTEAISGCADYFFSINQEAPWTTLERPYRQSVSEAVASQPRIQAISRYPNWIRAGYVDELFKISR